MTAEARNPQGASGPTKTCACRRDDASDCAESRFSCTCHWDRSDHAYECPNNPDVSISCACRCHDEHRAWRDDDDE